MNKLLLILIPVSVLSKEVTLSRTEKTILSFKDDIIATNCAPKRLGGLFPIRGFYAESGMQILQFVPKGRSGKIVCSAKTKRFGVVPINIRLRKSIKNPIVEIPLVSGQTDFKELRRFENYIKGKLDKFNKIDVSGSFSSDEFKYQIIEKYQSTGFNYYYKFLVSPKSKESGYLRLDNTNLTPIMFSHHKALSGLEIPGISLKNPSYLYLKVSESINLATFKRYLR